MIRLEWQRLADRWLQDAKAMLDAHRWSAAYYVAGYAVECALKACVLKRLVADEGVIFEDRRFSEKCWTHDIEELVRLARLETERDAARAANPTLAKNWLDVSDWSEKSRYKNTSHQKAKRLYNAIADNANGVMQWIKGHW